MGNIAFWTKNPTNSDNPALSNIKKAADYTSTAGFRN
jgi:hypothetical protein